MEILQLRDKELSPTKELIEKALGNTYPVYEEFIEMITTTKIGLSPLWNYYNDGKAWLCKVVYKKKTVFWLSIWENFFKIAFYFTEKNNSAIYEMDIDGAIKENYKNHKPAGKLLPLVINVNNKTQILDLLKIIEFKKSLK